MRTMSQRSGPATHGRARAVGVHRDVWTRCGLILLVVVGLSTAVWAHLKPVRTLPTNGAKLQQSPASLQVWFNEAPTLGFSGLSLAGPRGAVKISAPSLGAEKSVVATIEETLAPGNYQASWKTAGDDGHVVRGTFRFSIVASPPTSR